MSGIERRVDYRVPDGRLITEFISQEPFVASVVNLSHTGLYTVMPATDENSKRTNTSIQLEIPVPETADSIWASGEVVFKTQRGNGLGCGIRFKHMANAHRQMLKDMVEQGRQRVLEHMMEQIRWKKELCCFPSPFVAPPPPGMERTVPIFRLEDLERENFYY